MTAAGAFRVIISRSEPMTIVGQAMTVSIAMKSTSKAEDESDLISADQSRMRLIAHALESRVQLTRACEVEALGSAACAEA